MAMRPRLMTAIAVLGLTAACDRIAGSPNEHITKQHQSRIYPDYIPTRYPPPDFDPQGNRIFTAAERSAYPLASYKSFPVAIAALMQQADVEHGWCKGAGDDPQTLRACNRRDVLIHRLEQLGYCWGSDSAASEIEANKHWLKCRDDPSFAAISSVSFMPSFSDAEIAAVEHESAKRSGLAPGQRYAPVMIRPPRFDGAAQRIFLQEELDRQPPKLYALLPPLLRGQMRAADMESRLCVAGSMPDPERMRACNRRNVIAKRIEQQGYCSVFEAKAEAPAQWQWQWQRCTDDPGYDPKAPLLPPRQYSEREIAEAAAQAKELARRWAEIQRKQ
jgi:hypothetical protein